MRQLHTGEYPPDWKEIARSVKEKAGWRCVRCGHEHDIASGHMLGVHHLDCNKSNCRWWNLVSLCQKCHLQIQHKVVLRRQWMWDHTPWFRPYVAGYYAHLAGLPDDRETVLANVDRYIAIGQGREAEHESVGSLQGPPKDSEP